MKNRLSFAFLLLIAACTQPSRYASDIQVLHVQKNAAFVNPSETPLDSAELANFKGVFFYPVDETYKVKATLEKSTDTSSFNMPHTLNRTYAYKIYAQATFTLKGKTYTVPVYTNDELKKMSLLFFAYTDLTNGKETYKGGKYIDVPYDYTLQPGETAIDFNMAYFPYCAYSHRFSCPIVPKENHLDIAITAGEKLP